MQDPVGLSRRGATSASPPSSPGEHGPSNPEETILILAGYLVWRESCGSPLSLPSESPVRSWGTISDTGSAASLAGGPSSAMRLVLRDAGASGHDAADRGSLRSASRLRRAVRAWTPLPCRTRRRRHRPSPGAPFLSRMCSAHRSTSLPPSESGTPSVWDGENISASGKRPHGNSSTSSWSLSFA